MSDPPANGLIGIPSIGMAWSLGVLLDFGLERSVDLEWFEIWEMDCRNLNLCWQKGLAMKVDRMNTNFSQ